MCTSILYYKEQNSKSCSGYCVRNMYHVYDNHRRRIAVEYYVGDIVSQQWLINLRIWSFNWSNENMCFKGNVYKPVLSKCLDLRMRELFVALQWRHNERDGVSNHRRQVCFLNRLLRRRSKKTSKLRVTGLCEGNSQVTGEFPTQRASNADNVSIWWSHHVFKRFLHVRQ